MGEEGVCGVFDTSSDGDHDGGLIHACVRGAVMPGDSDNPFPPGVPPRRRRPRQEAELAGTVLGAAIGGLIVNPVGALIGALLGHAVSPREPFPLETALRESLHPYGLTLLQLYRYGPRKVRILVGQGASFWTLESEAPPHPALSQDDVDDWLYGDLIDYQFPKLYKGGVL